MIVPERALVRPRVICPLTKEVLPLEDQIQVMLMSGRKVAVNLCGGIGMGKTTAVKHLAAVLPQDAPILLKDVNDLYGDTSGGAVLFLRTALSPTTPQNEAALLLAPWGNDELIEYLLAKYPQSCASVMSRLKAGDHYVIHGVPEIWRIILDEMAAVPTSPLGIEALRRFLRREINDPNLLRTAGLNSVNSILEEGANSPTVETVVADGQYATLARVVRHFEARCLLATDYICEELRQRNTSDYLVGRFLPNRLLVAVAREIARDAAVMDFLRGLMRLPLRTHATVASLLRIADVSWFPDSTVRLNLDEAYLSDVCWQGVSLAYASLCGAELFNADLRRSNLDDAKLCNANLGGAFLAGAKLNRVDAKKCSVASADLSSAQSHGSNWDGADFTGAHMTGSRLQDSSLLGANLTRAKFVMSDLQKARLDHATIVSADFSQANLTNACLSALCLNQATFTGACFRRANLSFAVLEGMDLCDVDFSEAYMHEASLSDANLTGAILQHAHLCGAKLGNVTMERACLRDSDLREATFHMGSTRSGLLFTPIASEGTRTGFYTDDESEQLFKAPEEIRKANLRGADLRGAKIDNVDFYLVDLRDAKYDKEQEKHFRQCRAIL